MEFFDWLFGTRMGVLALFIGGIVVAFVVAVVLERGLSKRYYNHEKTEDDEDGGLLSGVFKAFDSEDE